MKMLVNRTPLTDALPFDLAALKAHLRIDFDDDDDGITTLGHAAAFELEEFSQIALLRQSIRITIFNPPRDPALRLPIGPVADADIPVVTVDGVLADNVQFCGGNRPYINSYSIGIESKFAGRVTIEYQAGFGLTALDVPRDLAQALMDQAAVMYDGRSPMDAKALTTSPHMARIGARYRGVSL